MTEETLKTKIGQLKIEQATLQVMHDKMVKEHTERTQTVNALAAQNQARFQQLTGAIDELEKLLATGTQNGDKKKARSPREPSVLPSPRS